MTDSVSERLADLKASVYPPTFSGKEEHWPYYKLKMTSYIAGAGMGDILTQGDQVEKDDHVWSTDTAHVDAVKSGNDSCSMIIFKRQR